MSGQRLSPRDGDLVRARLDTRGRDVVNGLLRLRPTTDGHVNVEVLLRTGALRDVDPDTVQVVQPRSITREMTSASAMLTLEDLRRQGRIRPVRPRQGGSWQDMVQRLDQAVEPLIEAGWTVGEGWHEETWEFGDSVSVPLERDSVRYTAELYEDDALALWTIGDDDNHSEADEDPADDPPEVEWFAADLDEAALRDWYHSLGLLP